MGKNRLIIHLKVQILYKVLSSQAILWEDTKYRNINKFNNIITIAINMCNYSVNSRLTMKDRSIINYKNKIIRIDP